MNYPQQAAGSRRATETILSASPSNDSIGVQFRIRLDFRLKHAGMTVLGREISLMQQAAGT